jgi:serine/threonine-protein kinase HipA
MTINGKTDAFTREDFKAVAQVAGLKRGRHEAILAEVIAAVKEWPRYAKTAGVPRHQADAINRTLRLKFDRGGVLTAAVKS